MKHARRPALRTPPRHRLERPNHHRSALVGTVAGLALAGTVVSGSAPALADTANDHDRRDLAFVKPGGGSGSGHASSRASKNERRDLGFIKNGGDDKAGGDQDAPDSSDNKDLGDDSIGARVLSIAASKAGTPYSYGATGPGAFDCSGFTQWVYNRAGRNLPRTSSAQAGAVRRISAGDARVGDLVFFTGSGGVYHVGIYAGNHAVWHSPRPGESVQRSEIWTDSVFYGRP